MTLGDNNFCIIYIRITDFRLTQVWLLYSKIDPPLNQVKPVSILFLRHILVIENLGDSALLRTTADLIILAFFPILHHAEYIYSSSKTKNFTLYGNKVFIEHHRINFLPRQI